MSQPTYGSFFSGGGIADIGAKAAGFELVFANEYDPKIAAVYAENLGDHIRVADIRDEDVRDYPRVNHFHASPVCTRASIANKNRGESQIDIDTARKVSEYIEFHKPDTVTIENVSQYRDFKSYKGIIQTLDACGYWHNASILNSADFGVPQTRRRLIARAVRGGFVPALPPKVKKWTGWYEAVSDIINTFEPSEFAPWQMERLPVDLKTFMINQNRTSFEWLQPDTDALDENQPSMTISTSGNRSLPRAFIVSSTEMRAETARDERTPMFTLKSQDRYPRAFIIDGQESSTESGLQIIPAEHPSATVQATQSRRPARAYLSQGRVVKISPRGLARFQSIPDWYILPDNKSLACKIIGNGWPSLMAQKVFESLRQ